MVDPVNVARIQEFSDGTPEGVRQLVELLVEDSRETLSAMTETFARSDRTRLSQLAHRLGGTCAAVGAPRLAEQLYELEERATTVPLPELASMISGIEKEISSTISFLTTYLEGRQEL